MDIWMNDRRLCARAPGATPVTTESAARKAGIPFVGVLSGGSARVAPRSRAFRVLRLIKRAPGAAPDRPIKRC
jgi:hypothetical protein